MTAKIVWPGHEERRLLARFYVALGLSRSLYLIYPFEFAYLYLIMDRPEWSVMPLMVMYATSLVVQLPTGAVADHWGRKAAVLTGAVLAAITYLAVPSASRLGGTAQLLAVCGAFAVIGLGQTLMMGAQEAWVVDNLNSQGREDLIEAFFARTYAVTSIGGVVSGSVAITLLLALPVDRALLDSLWYVTAAGFVAAAAVAIGIPEYRPDGIAGLDPALLPRMKSAFKTIFRVKSLLFLTLALFIANLGGSGADEAFPIALISTRIDARAIGPVSVAEDLLGAAAPLLALYLVSRFGVERLLSRLLLLSATAASALFAWRSPALIIALWIGLGFVDRMWDPVAMARLQEDIPSEHRAAIGSLVYQASGVAQLAGLGLLALLLGSHSSQLREATPDLVDAFTHRSSGTVPVPTGLLGLPIPELAILILVVVSVFAVPFVFMAGHARKNQEAALHDGRDEPVHPRDVRL